MTFRFKRVTEGEMTMDPLSVTVKYRAEGIPLTLPAADFFDYVASRALAVIPETYASSAGMLHRQDIQLHEVAYARKYLLTVPYGPRKRNTGAYQISVDQIGGTTHVTAGERISGWGASGMGGVGANEQDSPEKEDNGGLIGKDGDQVHGVDIPVEETKITVSYRHPAMKLIQSYIRGIGKLVGFPNEDTFLGYEPGEVLYLGGRFTESEAEATAQYDFAISYNRKNFKVGDITIGEKKGWDVVSPIYVEKNDDGKPERKIKYIEIIRPAGREWKDYKSAFGWG